MSKLCLFFKTKLKTSTYGTSDKGVLLFPPYFKKGSKLTIALQSTQSHLSDGWHRGK